ncbi:MAG: homospermidine synthase [Candidatus Omnitrophica bacterium]|nr:homospermidine synthase [Candidatus Omnitrophota bacterium]
MKFKGKLLVIGCGSVSQCTIPLLLKHLQMPAQNITIMDFVDNRSLISESLKKGVCYVQKCITRENYASVLRSYVGAGDMIIDLAWNIDCCTILDWCHRNRVLYVNTSVELWDPYEGAEDKKPTERTLYVRHMAIREMVKKWKNQKGATAVVEHGANPGLVSHFTKKALEDIVKLILQKKPRDPRRKDFEVMKRSKNFAGLAQLTGTKVIHISERDTQITNRPKEVNEFVNTWSIEGFREEGVAPAEMGWGTHERYLPPGAQFHSYGPGNQICLVQPGIKTWVRSWVPCGEIIGMVVRHGEAFTISDHLTVWKDGVPVYRPTVHYAYCPCDAAICSLAELEMRRFDLQKNQRIMNDEIVSGRDELGVLLMGHDFKSWWTGSLLDIEETRQLVPHQNATTLQVACSVLASTLWIMQNPNEGVCVPDDLPHDFVLKIAEPYLGPFISKPVDWTPLKHDVNLFEKYNGRKISADDVWQFTTFLIK